MTPLRLREVNEGITQIAQQLSVDHAGGIYLDFLGGLLDIRRHASTYSRVTATLTGVAGTGVPAGSRARTDPGTDEFVTLSDVVLSPSGVTVDMQSCEARTSGSTSRDSHKDRHDYSGLGNCNQR